MVEQWEPCESRGSRTVLREAEGEVPLVYLPRDTASRRRRERAISLCARAALHAAARGR